MFHLAHPVYFGCMTAWLMVGAVTIALAIKRRSDRSSSLRQWLTDPDAIWLPTLPPEPRYPLTLPWLSLLFLTLAVATIWLTYQRFPSLLIYVYGANIVLAAGVGFATLSVLSIAAGSWTTQWIGLANFTFSWISLINAVVLVIIGHPGRTSGTLSLAAVCALAMAGWWWHWLGGVWHQQLDHDRAWTVTGGLVSPAANFGLLCHSLGSLLAAALTVLMGRQPSAMAAPQSYYWLALIWTLLFLAAISFRMNPGPTAGRAWPLLTFLVFLTVMWVG